MYKKEKRSWLKHLDFTILDILLFQISYLLSYWIRFGLFLPYTEEMYRHLAFIIGILQICMIFFTEPYKNILRRDKLQELKAVITQSTLVFCSILLYLYAIKMLLAYSRILLFVYWGLAVLFSYIGHIFLKKWIIVRLSKQENQLTIILVTADAKAESCITDFGKASYCRYEVKGIVIWDKDRQGDVIKKIPVIANKNNLMKYIRNEDVDDVFINIDDIDSREALAEQLLEMGLKIHFKLAHESEMKSNKVIEKCGPYVVLTSSIKIISPKQLFAKRCMDIAGSIVGLLLTAVAYLIFAPIIKIQSPGPVFFVQTRVGKNGRKFKMYKFRSMYMDAEERKKELMKQNEMKGFMFKMEDDPRIFPIGKFIRKCSIDELPQFWNVLKGDMSLVGTRPPTVDEFEQYESHHYARLSYKPGITGMWQVSGRSKIADFEEVVRLDTAYISNWSLWLDIRILFKTVLVVLLRKGAE